MFCSLSCRLFLLAALLVVAGGAHAILIRHDTGYTRYEASEADYPAVFYLHRQERRRICVATVIAPQWAITAAHCTHETPLLETLTSGQAYPVTIAGQTAQIDHVQWHPHYPQAPLPGRPDVDLALLRFSEPLTMPRPVPLYRDTDEQGRVVTFLGWGFHGLGRGGSYLDDGRFRFANNTVAQASERLRFVFDDPRQSGNNALEFEGVPGLGDSGGPALIRVDSVYAIAGVAVGEVSGGEAAGEDSSPRQGLYGAEVVYERLSIHQQWIDSVIASTISSTTEKRPIDSGNTQTITTVRP